MEAAQRQMRFLANAVSDYPGSSCFGMLAMMDALYPHRELICVAADGIPAVLTEWMKEHPAEDLQILLKTAENMDLLNRCAAHPNFIISSGCDIPPMSPWENIDAFFAAAAE